MAVPIEPSHVVNTDIIKTDLRDFVCTPLGQLGLPEAVRVFGYRWSKSLMSLPFPKELYLAETQFGRIDAHQRLKYLKLPPMAVLKHEDRSGRPFITDRIEAVLGGTGLSRR